MKGGTIAIGQGSTSIAIDYCDEKVYPSPRLPVSYERDQSKGLVIYSRAKSGGGREEGSDCGKWAKGASSLKLDKGHLRRNWLL